MTIVPLKHLGKLERLRCINWCKFNIGEESAYTWFCVDATNDDYSNPRLCAELSKEGYVYSIVFIHAIDASGFKITFGL